MRGLHMRKPENIFYAAIAFQTVSIAHAMTLPESPAVTREPAPVEKVFVPQGFDDNDNVEVIVQGRFPDACMKTGPVGKTINAGTKTISLKPEVYAYRGEPCAQVIVPFIQRVSLGTLPEGEWRISVEGMPAVSPLPLVISKARSASPDDFLYAPVEEVVLLPAMLGSKQKLVISGNWPMLQTAGCFALVDMRVRTGADNTLVVQPISQILPPSRCSVQASRKRVFQKSVLLEKPLSADSLIHVRTLNGESLNKFFEGQ